VAPDTVVAGYNNQKVKIHFEDENSFKFESATGDQNVTSFFGGTYSKQ
jgi:hypothetical protein